MRILQPLDVRFNDYIMQPPFQMQHVRDIGDGLLDDLRTFVSNVPSLLVEISHLIFLLETSKILLEFPGKSRLKDGA